MWKEAICISNRKTEIRYIFENPNKNKDIEKLLRQIIIEKLLRLYDLEPRVI